MFSSDKVSKLLRRSTKNRLCLSVVMFIAYMLMLTNTNAQAQTICEFDNGKFNQEIEMSTENEFVEAKFVAARKGTNFQIKACSLKARARLGYLYVSSASDGEDPEIFQVMYKYARYEREECELNDQQTDLTMYANDPVAFENAFRSFESCIEALEKGGYPCYTTPE